LAGPPKLANQSQPQQRPSLPLPLRGGVSTGASSSASHSPVQAPPSPLRPGSAMSRAGAEVAGLPVWQPGAGAAQASAPQQPRQSQEAPRAAQGRFGSLWSAFRFFSGSQEEPQGADIATPSSSSRGGEPMRRTSASAASRSRVVREVGAGEARDREAARAARRQRSQELRRLQEREDPPEGGRTAAVDSLLTQLLLL